MEQLNKTNYYSVEMSMEYLGYTQYKDFMECENKALAKCKGLYKSVKTTALLVGSYVDAYFSNEMEEFKAENPEIFKKDGTLKADYLQADKIIEKIKSQPFFYRYLRGKSQEIITGIINGVKFKGKIDSLLDDCIVDLKVMASLEPVWVRELDSETGFYKNVLKNIILAYRYDIEGAIYQELYYQMTGKKLPFILAIATKEDGTNLKLVEIPQEYLDRALEEVKQNAPRIDAIKKGLIEPTHCGKCEVCYEQVVVDHIDSLEVLNP